MVAFGDVTLYGVGGYCADASEEFSRAPEMPGTEVSPQPGVILKERVGAVAFQALQCLGHRHCRWQVNEAVHVIRHYFKLDDVHRAAMRCTAYRRRAQGSYGTKLTGVLRPLELPDQVETVLPDRMT